MGKKQLLFEENARHALLRGAETLCKAVSTTLGPKGRNVVICNKFGSPLITKDGVTVAKEIELQDPYENIGAALIKEVASKTNEKAGDGTTTATILAESIFRAGMKYIVSGANPIDIQRGIQVANNSVATTLSELAKKVKNKEDIKQVATVSANWDKTIGEMIADAMDKVGNTGVITVEEAKGMETTLDIVEGMQFDKGYISPYFVTSQETLEVKMTDPFILILNKKVSLVNDILPILEKTANVNRPLLIIAEDVDGEALATLVVNKLRGILNVAAVKAPGFGDRKTAILEDIAIITGGKCISNELGMKIEDVSLSDLGKAKSVIITKDSTTIVEGYGSSDDVQSRINLLQVQISAAESDYDREKLQERLAKLSGGVAVINVGAATETEMKERKARVEDSLNATRAAVEEGLVPGGGVALIRCIPALESLKLENEDAQLGVEIVKRAIEEPLRVLAKNAGIDSSLIVQEVKRHTGNIGYNVATGKYVDLVKDGVVDPKKVTRTALQNACSIAALMLTTECAIVDVPDKKNNDVPPIPNTIDGMGGMGGMY